jgi:glycosyltransferase involved in cell wall biosynthesis
VIKVTHIITGLGVGGAEMMLLKLLASMDPVAFRNDVISLTGDGPIGQRIRSLGIPLIELEIDSRRLNPLKLARLIACIRRARPHIVQTWMYHADLLGGIAGRIARTPVVWCIQSGALHPQLSSRRTRMVVKSCAQLSRRMPRRIVAVAEASRRVHTTLGYARDKFVVIPNGIDTKAFRPDEENRVSVRRELEISDDATLIGMVARFDPQKDHKNFLDAAGLLARSDQAVRFVLCGDGVTWDNAMLTAWIAEAGIRDRIALLGRRTDTWRVTSALDIASLSSSFGEGLPNVIGEAMSCAVPCVVTDVGDSGLVVGYTGRVVSPGDARSLANGWRELIDLGAPQRKALGLRARQRIEDQYSLSYVVGRYEKLYEEIVAADAATYPDLLTRDVVSQ